MLLAPARAALCSPLRARTPRVRAASRSLARPVGASVFTFHLGFPARHESGGMAWRSHGHDNNSLIDALHKNGVITDARVEAAFRAVDRGHYVVAPYRGEAYVDAPLPIGYGQTISAPHMHAACCEELRAQLRPGARVLDVGSGSGYLTAVLAQLVRPSGRVTGVEVVAPLVERSRKALDEDPSVRAARAEGVALAVHEVDAHWGWPADAPYDAIHVGAAAEEVPAALVQQLAPGGRMIIPVGRHGWAQVLMCIDKDASGHVTKRQLMGVQYVPLVHGGKKPPEGSQQHVEGSKTPQHHEGGTGQAREE